MSMLIVYDEHTGGRLRFAFVNKYKNAILLLSWWRLRITQWTKRHKVQTVQRTYKINYKYSFSVLVIRALLQTYLAFDFCVAAVTTNLTPEGPAVRPHKRPDFPLKRHAEKKWRGAMKFHFSEIESYRLFHAVCQFSASDSNSNYPFAPQLQVASA
jgi:hypothetical protein